MNRRTWRKAAACGLLAAAGVALAVGGASAQAAPEAARPAGPPVRASWTSDRVPLRVGDVVTILIDEVTQISADRNDAATRERERDLSLAAQAGKAGSASGNLRTGNDVSARNRGEASRTEHFAAEMTTRVVEVGPGGTLRLEGTKKVKVDKHEQEVTVRGWVRSQDVAVDNTVPSWRVADADISYLSNGSLVKAGGIWSKLLDLIVP
ncbi:MAG: flagellar basal body L-ring protein FlgH [Gemmatimonadetes bacterium]|nr:flagellar basal body L-ring protein FlgH [Gemmatimonadota bacterium]